jgi:hypothetical protein
MCGILAASGLPFVSPRTTKIGSFGDSRLYALAGVVEQLSHSSQPLVPERVFLAGGGSENGQATTSQGLLGTLISLLVAEKSGFLSSAMRAASQQVSLGIRAEWGCSVCSSVLSPPVSWEPACDDENAHGEASAT